MQREGASFQFALSPAEPYRMDRHSVLMHFFDIIHFCAVARYFYSCDDSELASQPVHMLIPWFSARFHNLTWGIILCVFRSRLNHLE